jgi:hypothetical protein
MGGVAHGAFEKLYLAARAFQLFQQAPLMDIMAGPTIGWGDEAVSDLGASDSIAEAISPRQISGRSTLALIAEHSCGPQRLTLRRKGRLHTRQLGLKRLRLTLALRRDADIDTCSSRCPPTGVDPAFVVCD